MSEIRDLLRLKFDSYLSHRDIATILTLGGLTASKVSVMQTSQGLCIRIIKLLSTLFTLHFLRF